MVRNVGLLINEWSWNETIKMDKWKNTRKYIIQNEESCLKIGATLIDENMRIAWDSLITKESKLIHVEGMKECRRRPKIILIEVVKKDMSIKKVTESMISYKMEW